jgi:hypothetical protein
MAEMFRWALQFFRIYIFLYEVSGIQYTAVYVEASWNVMAHAQKPDFVFRRNGQVHLNYWGASVQSTTGSRGVRISGSNAGYTMFRGSVKSTGYPLHSPVSPSPPVRHRMPSHFNWSLPREMWGNIVVKLIAPFSHKRALDVENIVF